MGFNAARHYRTADAFGSEATPKVLTAASVFEPARSESPDATQAVLYVHYSPANSGEIITIEVEVMEPGGELTEATDFHSLVTSAIAAGVTTLSRQTFVFTSTSAGENRFAIPVPVAFRAIRVGAKDSVGTTGTAWIQVDFVE